MTLYKRQEENDKKKKKEKQRFALRASSGKKWTRKDKRTEEVLAINIT